MMQCQLNCIYINKVNGEDVVDRYKDCTCLGHLGWHTPSRIGSICVSLPKVAKTSRDNNQILFFIKTANINDP